MTTVDAVSLAINRYAIYQAAEVTAQIYEHCRNAERHASVVIDTIRKQETFSKAIPPGEYEYDFSLEMLDDFKQMLEEIGSLATALTSLDRFPSQCRLGALILRAGARQYLVKTLTEFGNKHMPPLKTALITGEFWMPPKEDIILLQGTIFSYRIIFLEPSMQSLNDKLETRSIRSGRTESAREGGRPRDAGVWPLIRAAVAAGLTIQQLAERLVSLDLDRARHGSRAQRIRRETSRLNKAKGRMPSGQNLY